jgi:putative membrane protein
MSTLASPEGKTRIAKAIGAIEKKSSAEIVAVLRASSGSYRHADLAFGAIVALGILSFFLYHPDEFDFTWLPLEQAAGFVLGALVCSKLPPLRRLLSGGLVRKANVLSAARAAFVELGISKTRARSGILLYLSLLERDVVLVRDVGIDEKELATDLTTAETALRDAFRADNLDDFEKAFLAVGEALARVHPVTDDDIDELPNEVAA